MKIILGSAIRSSDPVRRDAIHVPLLPAIAGEKLAPGQGVYMDGSIARSSDNKSVRSIGIVDPFLSRMIHENERIWIMLYPDSINGLRHQWTHPDIFDEDPLTNEEYDDEYDDGCAPGCG